MFSVEDFISKYEKYSDEELMEINSGIDGYSKEAEKALAIVIDRKGGMDRLLKSLERKKIIRNEIKRIAKETHELGSQGIDSSFIKTVTSSAILSAGEVKEIIDNKYVEVEAAIQDKKINSRTIVGSIAGGGIASVIGGTLWGLQMIYSKRIFYIFFPGLFIISYAIIKVLTKQSQKNKVVLIATIISVILSVIIGQLLYEIIGYQE